MKKITNLFILISLTLLMSCDPGYAIYIKNSSDKEKLYIITNPPIESDLTFKNTTFYDSIIFKKVNPSDVLTGKYKIEPRDKIYLLGYIGKPSSNYFPFKKIEVIKGTDTIKINKNNFIEKINKKVKNFYYIEIQ